MEEEKNEKNNNEGTKEETEHQVKKEEEGKKTITIKLSTFIIILILIIAIVAIIIGYLISKKSETNLENQIVGNKNNNESTEFNSLSNNETNNLIKGTTNNNVINETMPSNNASDFSSFLGLWGSDKSNITNDYLYIYEVKNNKVTFDFGKFANKITGTLNGNTAEFSINEGSKYLNGTISLINNKVNLNIKNSTFEDVKPGTIVYSDYLGIQGSETEPNNTEIESNQSERQNAMSAIRNALKDEKWVNQNLKFSNDYLEKMGGINANDKQVLNFIICVTSSTPVVIVKDDVSIRTRVDLVSYSNGKITATNLIFDENPNFGETKVDPNKGIITTEYGHMGSYRLKYFNVSDGTLKNIGNYRMESKDESYTEYNYYSEGNQISEAEYNKAMANLNLSQYNFYSIGTPLTSQNIDAYIK